MFSKTFLKTVNAFERRNQVVKAANLVSSLQ